MGKAGEVGANRLREKTMSFGRWSQRLRRDERTVTECGICTGSRGSEEKGGRGRSLRSREEVACDTSTRVGNG
jgi:hypothetical protein